MNENKSSVPTLNVKIIALGEIIWNGEAKSITAENTSGVFDILPEHTNFISILKETPITIQTENEKKEFSFPRSLLYAKANMIKIYTGI
jgi:F0F1-type ATP synthase epsilon subunit